MRQELSRPKLGVASNVGARPRRWQLEASRDSPGWVHVAVNQEDVMSNSQHRHRSEAILRRAFLRRLGSAIVLGASGKPVADLLGFAAAGEALAQVLLVSSTIMP
jgi:hypothetical protein